MEGVLNLALQDPIQAVISLAVEQVVVVHHLAIDPPLILKHLGRWCVILCYGHCAPPRSRTTMIDQTLLAWMAQGGPADQSVAAIDVARTRDSRAFDTGTMFGRSCGRT